MQKRTTVAIAAVLGSLAVGGAWTGFRPNAARVDQAMKWNATLNSMNGSTVKGTASLAPGTSATSSVATVTISGGKAGTTYPWHVHTGTCAAGGGVFGGGGSYKPVAAGTDGSGTSTANLAAAPPSSGDYHVNIHASSTDMKTIVACGDFKMAM